MSNQAVASCSERIKQALAIRGMKQAELCERTKIPKSAISEYISGAYEPKQDRLFIMAQALRVDPVWLMGFDVPMNKEEKKEKAPTERQLSEGQRLLLDLYDQLPEDKQRMFIEMLRAAAKAL